jgi:schlafen family protein
VPAYSPVKPTTRFRLHDHVETEVFDLKLEIEGWSAIKIAKHVAEFANHLGGTLLIGAKEEGGRIGYFKTLNAQDETAVRKRISDAVEQHCNPLPLFESVPVSHDGGFFVAVNVPPVLGGVVGVRVKTLKTDADYGGDTFFFPARVGVSGGHITPATMHTHMLPELRRTMVILRAIPCSPELPANVHFAGEQADRRVIGIVVEESLNCVTFECVDRKATISRPSISS